MSKQSQQELEIRSRVGPEGMCVEIIGDLHLPSVQRFQELIQAVIEPRLECVELDFRQVIFMDSAGVKALLSLRKQLSLYSCPLRIRLIAGSQPDRVLCMTRLDTVIGLIYDQS